MLHANSPSLVLAAFLRDLSEVSYKHGLAVGDDGEIFIMEEADYESCYHSTEGGFLKFDQ